MEPKRIILDTNFFLIPSQYGVDVFSALRECCNFKYELATVRPVILELEELAERNDLHGRAAKAGLELIESKGISIVEGEKVLKADGFILGVVRRDRDLVATQDRELRRALKEKGIPRIVLRKGKILEIVW